MFDKIMARTSMKRIINLKKETTKKIKIQILRKIL